MPLTLTVGATALELPGGLQWSDRDWRPVVARGTPLFGGGHVRIDAPAGARPVTLASGRDSAYLSAAQRTQLLAWAATPGQQMTLAGLRGEASMVVMFRHQDGALATEPVDADNNGHGATRWRATIRLEVVG